MGLAKIAVDLARRLFLAGAAAKVVPKIPNMALGAGESVTNNMIGMALPGSGITKAVRGLNSINNANMSIGQWRMYRMNVKAGIPKEQALAKVYASTKSLPIARPKMFLDRGKNLKAGIETVNHPMHTVKRIANVKSGNGIWNKAMTLLGNTKKEANSITGAASEMLRHYQGGCRPDTICGTAVNKILLN